MDLLKIILEIGEVFTSQKGEVLNHSQWVEGEGEGKYVQTPIRTWKSSSSATWAIETKEGLIAFDPDELEFPRNFIQNPSAAFQVWCNNNNIKIKYK